MSQPRATTAEVPKPNSSAPSIAAIITSRPGLRDELDTDPGHRIGLLQVVNQLGQVFDAVDIVMGRWRDQRNARDRMPQMGDVGVHLVLGQLAAFAGL